MNFNLEILSSFLIRHVRIVIFEEQGWATYIIFPFSNVTELFLFLNCWKIAYFICIQIQTASWNDLPRSSSNDLPRSSSFAYPSYQDELKY